MCFQTSLLPRNPVSPGWRQSSVGSFVTPLWRHMKAICTLTVKSWNNCSLPTLAESTTNTTTTHCWVNMSLTLHRLHENLWDYYFYCPSDICTCSVDTNERARCSLVLCISCKHTDCAAHLIPLFCKGLEAHWLLQCQSLVSIFWIGYVINNKQEVRCQTVLCRNLYDEVKT